MTYLERAEWHLLALLDPAATRYALQESARERRAADERHSGAVAG